MLIQKAGKEGEQVGTASKVLSAAAEHPAYTPDNCINRRQRRYVCTVCSSVCPRGVFSLKAGETLKWDRCLDCGLCAAACPSGCFAPSASAQRRFTEDLDLKKPVSFSCREEEERGDRRVRCLAAVPWELLAMLAMHTELVLYTGACAGCGHADWAARVTEQLALLRDFLGEERWSRQVHVLTEGRFETDAGEKAEEPEKLLSRREMFSGVGRRVAKGLYKAAAARLPLLGEFDTDGMQYRRALAEAVLAEQKRALEEAKPGEKAPDYGVKLPRFTVNCYGCGICEKLCPQKAIEIGPEREGKRLIYLTPWKCAGCSLCEHACPHGGISELHMVRVPKLTRLALVRVPSASCERCGTAIPPGSDPPFCPACAARARRGKK